MGKKAKAGLIVVAFLIFASIMLLIWSYEPAEKTTVKVNITCETSKSGDLQLFYSNSDKESTTFDSKKSEIQRIAEKGIGKTVEISYDVPCDTTYLRLDFAETESDFRIYKLEICGENGTTVVDNNDLVQVDSFNSISAYFIDKGIIYGSTTADDPYISWNLSKYNISSLATSSKPHEAFMIHVVASIVTIICMVVLFLIRHRFMYMPKEIIANRKMIFDLAKTDFKNKYATSFFGTVWAFVQPIVTIAIYVFVFQVGFKAGDTSTGYPFLLYLVAGIIPWFFFSEAWMNSTNCLIEYNYLVKKVVFKIEVLPIVKVVSSFFVHLFFIGLAFVLYTINGRIPGWTMLQIIYYLICTVAFVLSLSYFTAAITPFFPDTYQIINILTQIGMWTIPIMYDEGIMGPSIMKVLRLNPMYYVVTGYRDCYMHGQWFWERTGLTLYFWVITIILFYIGYKTFKKLKIHFADVI